MADFTATRLVVIYKHTNVFNGKIYVGQTVNPSKRWYGNGIAYKRCRCFYNAILKYQKMGYSFNQAFKHEVLCTVPQNEADEIERHYIALYHSNQKKYGYNITNGGRGDGWDEETISRISQKEKGKIVPPEVGKKISLALKGKKMPIEAVKKSAQSRRGRHLSEETKAKISAANKGKKRTPQFCLECSERAKKQPKRRGYTRSAETKLKISLANKRRFSNPEERQKISETKKRQFALAKQQLLKSGGGK